ncbi:MAG: saccharopine dehydrogenase NADP-binding domain-containing protein [Planctomycetota bacterium]|nr:saccharopine dehydrogenase NADP-binding domain-containing protein [Planctomycetota bacterium]
MKAREFDLIVWGATGYTGRLVVEYLAGREGLRWAIGGRDEARLAALRDELGPRVADVPLVLADAMDPASLLLLAARPRVVITPVGPLARYGGARVAACVEAGTHCCDLTGEVPWLRGVIDRHHATSVERGLRLVSMCGYDSVPSDLGCLLLQEAVFEATGSFAPRVDCLAGPSRGGVSGGTIASAAFMMEQRREPGVARYLTDPGALTPGHRPPERPDPVGIARVAGTWAGPWVMAGINGRVVHRTHQLLGLPWGADFVYAERFPTGRGPLGLLGAAGLWIGTVCFAVGMALAPTRALLLRFLLPAPGEGPSANRRERGYFNHHLVATDGERVLGRLRIHADLDPGYVGTAAMLAECALATLDDELDTKGVLTPGAAFGARLRPALEAAGFRFELRLGEEARTP